MKANNKDTGHNRTIRLTDLPETPAKTLPALTIQITYQAKENDGQVIDKAVTLDGVVIPAILDLINRKRPELDEVTVSFEEDQEGVFCQAKAQVSYPTGHGQDRRLEWLTSGGLLLGAEPSNADRKNAVIVQLNDLRVHLTRLDIDASNWKKLTAELYKESLPRQNA